MSSHMEDFSKGCLRDHFYKRKKIFHVETRFIFYFKYWSTIQMLIPFGSLNRLASLFELKVTNKMYFYMNDMLDTLFEMIFETTDLDHLH